MSSIYRCLTFVLVGKCFYFYLSMEYFFCFQEANKRNNNWLPPPWAILALVILGFNEFMTLLRCISTVLISCLIAYFLAFYFSFKSKALDSHAYKYASLSSSNYTIYE
ncbi:unnamed protein product [Lupinus luteus]|uniref:Sey1/RHD3-like three-helix bundle domain-containing protein n=1 Tax=Lupinus luteus TaxID=3873 RepID=A0AAV1WNF2_LUPLU